MAGSTVQRKQGNCSRPLTVLVAVLTVLAAYLQTKLLSSSVEHTSGLLNGDSIPGSSKRGDVVSTASLMTSDDRQGGTTLHAQEPKVPESKSSTTLTLNDTATGSEILVSHTDVPELVIRPICSFDSLQMTCAWKLAKNEGILSQCKQDPFLPQCDLNCIDGATQEFPGASFDVLIHEDEKSRAMKLEERLLGDDKLQGRDRMWPPLGSNGQWIDDPRYCDTVKNTTGACLFGKYRYVWDEKWNRPTIWTKEDACQLLKSRNVTRIRVVGDSLLRHLSQGLVIVLKGDYDYQFGHKGCVGDRAFSEKGCRGFGVTSVCYNDESKKSGGISIAYLEREPATWKLGSASRFRSSHARTLFFYGAGNHPATAQHGLNERYGILNATEYLDGRWSVLQSQFWGPFNYFVWVPPHYKLRIGRSDETNQRVYQFLVDSHNFFQFLGARTLNAFDMTRAMASFFSFDDSAKKFYFRETCQETLETWDGFHYNRTVNLWKAHLALHQFQSSFPV